MRLFVVLITLMALALPVAAQDDSGLNPKAGYVGFAYDDHKSNLATGLAFNVGGDLYNFVGILYSKEAQTVSYEVAYLFDFNTVFSFFGALDEPLFKIPTIFEKIKFGPVAGPNGRWEERPNENPLMRVLGATGAVGYCPINKDVVVWVFWEHKFKLENSSFLDRNTFATGLSYSL